MGKKLKVPIKYALIAMISLSIILTSGSQALGKNPNSGKLEVSVTGVSLNSSYINLLVGQTFKLIANVSPVSATNKNVVWTTSSPNVATVDPKGKVLAVGVGRASITVTTVDGGYQATAEVTVGSTVIAVTGVSLDKATLNLIIGDTDILVATVEESNATNKEVTWSSSDEIVATVDQTGLVTAVGAGPAIITVTTVDGGYRATSEVRVESPYKLDSGCVNCHDTADGQESEELVARYNDMGYKLLTQFDDIGDEFNLSWVTDSHVDDNIELMDWFVSDVNKSGNVHLALHTGDAVLGLDNKLPAVKQIDRFLSSWNKIDSSVKKEIVPGNRDLANWYPLTEGDWLNALGEEYQQRSLISGSKFNNTFSVGFIRVIVINRFNPSFSQTIDWVTFILQHTQAKAVIVAVHDDTYFTGIENAALRAGKTELPIYYLHGHNHGGKAARLMNISSKVNLQAYLLGELFANGGLYQKIIFDDQGGISNSSPVWRN